MIEKTTCTLCFHHCTLGEGETGLCHARKMQNGSIVCANYGLVTSLALEPIEKKPLARFYPGSKVLSVGSFGCNLHCPFCQNFEIATAGEEQADTFFISPQELTEKAFKRASAGNIGLAFTYNEPLVGYEYVRDCAELIHKQGLKNILVTNGTICEEPLIELLPLIDAMNIDLKGFTQPWYDKLGGDLETVKRTILLAAQHCHVEVTTLIVPKTEEGAGSSQRCAAECSDEEMEALTEWLAGINPEIPLHLTRFFPCWKMSDCAPTDVAAIYRLAAIARKRLKYVYVGNC